MAFQVSEEIENKMKRRFQRLIRKNGLIDTGALWRSIDITATISDAGQLHIKVYSEDYLKYLDERFVLSSDFVNARGFATIAAEAYTEWVQYMTRRFPLLEGFDRVLQNVRSSVTVEIVN
jgi:hypothetical protein